MSEPAACTGLSHALIGRSIGSVHAFTPSLFTGRIHTFCSQVVFRIRSELQTVGGHSKMERSRLQAVDDEETAAQARAARRDA